MAKLYADHDRYANGCASIIVEATIETIRDIVRHVADDIDVPFGQAVFGEFDRELTVARIEEVERRLLDSGHRFKWSSAISLRDRPDIYVAKESNVQDFSFEHSEATVLVAEPNGRQQRGFGDNVIQTSTNVCGHALYVRTSEQVLRLMRGAVPADCIAVIDDAGGTLTAPILDCFKGVICAGGTIRSHLGILTREYGIPCLMNARISGIRDGDRVEIESSALARTTESYASGIAMPARIWKLP